MPVPGIDLAIGSPERPEFRRAHAATHVTALRRGTLAGGCPAAAAHPGGPASPGTTSPDPGLCASLVRDLEPHHPPGHRLCPACSGHLGLACPAAFQWALRNDTVHFMEHLCFLLSAHLFWWSMLHRGGSSLQRYGANTLWVLSTLIHTGFLGAVLTFARYPLYTYYAEQAQTVRLLWGLSPLEDQQLGGTLMWVLGAGPYLLAGLVLVLLCLRALERRASH